MKTKLALVDDNSAAVTKLPAPMSDSELEQHAVTLLEEVQTLRDEISANKSAYMLAMQINYRLRLRADRLEQENAVLSIALKTFTPKAA